LDVGVLQTGAELEPISWVENLALVPVLDGQLTNVQKGNVTLHFEDVEREDLWRTIL
jgi:hypothetical protein